MAATEGQRIAVLRVAAGVSSRRFAYGLGVSHGHISLIESNQRGPGPKLISRISGMLGVRPEWLHTGLGWTYSPPSPFDAYARFIQLIEGQVLKRVVLLIYAGQTYSEEKGLVLEIPEGVVSLPIGSGTSDYRDDSTRAYGTVLERLQRWNGPVGRIILSTEESQHINQLDLADLIPQALFDDWIFADELQRTREGDFVGSYAAARLRHQTTEAPLEPIRQAELQQIHNEFATRIRKREAPARPALDTKTHLRLILQDPQFVADVALLDQSDADTRTLIRQLLLLRREELRILKALKEACSKAERSS